MVVEFVAVEVEVTLAIGRLLRLTQPSTTDDTKGTLLYFTPLNMSLLHGH
jgi:hypothetical protein